MDMPGVHWRGFCGRLCDGITPTAGDGWIM
jgi:hypothetical protein